MNTEKLILSMTPYGYYRIASGDSAFLSSLFDFLREGEHFINRIKEQILSNTTKGRWAANLAVVRFNPSTVFIQPFFDEDEDELRIEISKNYLLKAIFDWEKIIQQDPDEILMMRDEHGNITFEGVFKPETSKN